MIIQGLTVLKVGGAIGQYYLVPYLGVNNKNGNLLFLNQEGKPTEVPTLPDDRRFTGKNLNPEYQGAIKLNLQYKGLFLNTNWDFTHGIYRFDNEFARLVNPKDIGNYVSSKAILDNWTPKNKNAAIPSYTASNLAYSKNSNRFLRDSDYFRLRFVKLGYQFPVQLLKSIGLRGAGVYVSATNIFAITPWRGPDPALNSNNPRLYPDSKIYSAGINIKF